MNRPDLSRPFLSPSRRAITLALLFAPSVILARQPACGPAPRVLFVCEAGTVNSAIARELFNAAAEKAGMDARATSRGLHPEDHLTQEVAARLRADGVDPTRDPARPLTATDLAAADVIIAFNGADQAPGLEPAQRWSVPSWSADYVASKTAMDARIKGLIAALGGRQAPGCEGRPG